MNYTKDFQDYIGIVKNTFVNKFHFKCEKYNPIDKCTIILRQMIEVENNIDSLKTGKIIIEINIFLKNIFIIFKRLINYSFNNSI